MDKTNAKNTEIQKILNLNQKLTEEKPKEKEKKIMLFLSFDIKDSTELKVKYKNEWVSIINKFFNVKFEYMDFWKFNGDEILYKKQIKSLEFIFNIIDKAYSFLQTLQESMRDKIPEIYIKGTLWIALAENVISSYENNFYFTINDFCDFVGKNIDEGFRLTKCSSIMKLAIDPKIVYILLDVANYFKTPLQSHTVDRFMENVSKNNDVEEKVNNILSNIYLMGFSKCKGVWDDYPYPIFWYFANLSDKGIKYGEFLDNVHLWPHEKHCLSDDVTGNFSKLQQIFKQVSINKEIGEIYNNLTMSDELPVSSEVKANLYYMVACVNPKTKNVLIAKRSLERKHLKGVWDFGNVKYQNINIKKIIEKEYKNTFGIDIQLITEGVERDYNLKPFGYCTIYRNCRPHNCILCYAIIKNPNNLDDIELKKYILDKKSDKYDQIEFVNEEEAKKFIPLSLDQIRIDSQDAERNVNKPFENNSCIMYFQDSIKRAIIECTKQNS